jgi:hypothetical protein
MMFRGGFFWRFLLALVIVGGLAAGGAALFRAGWAQGYQVGALSSSAEGSEAVPNPPFYYGYPRPYFGPGFGFPLFFAPFGFFLWIGFFLLMFFLVGNLFRFWGWRRWHGGPWRSGGEHGPMPPGSREWHERHKEQAEGSQGAAQAPGENR